MKSQNNSPMTVSEAKQLRSKLRKLSALDVRDIPAEQLVDIQKVHINKGLPPEDRIVDYVEQIGNPYCYRCNGIAVKVSFAGERSLEDCIKEALFAGESGS